MSATIINLIIQIVSGAIGGNIAGSLFTNIVLSPLLKTISGAVGGGLGGTILQSLIPALGSAASSGGVDIGTALGNAASSSVTGAIDSRGRPDQKRPGQKSLTERRFTPSACRRWLLRATKTGSCGLLPAGRFEKGPPVPRASGLPGGTTIDLTGQACGLNRVSLREETSHVRDDDHLSHHPNCRRRDRGNIFAKVTQFTLGPLVNSIVGAVGGALGGLIFQSLGPELTGAITIGSVLPRGDRRRQRCDRHRACQSLHASYRLLSHATSAIQGLMVSHGCRKTRSHCSVPACAQSSNSRASFSITWFSMIGESSRS